MNLRLEYFILEQVPLMKQEGPLIDPLQNSVTVSMSLSTNEGTFLLIKILRRWKDSDILAD